MEFKVSQVQLWQLIMFNLFARFNVEKKVHPELPTRVWGKWNWRRPNRREATRWDAGLGAQNLCVSCCDVVFRFRLFSSERFSVQLPVSVLLPDPEFATCGRPHVGRRIQKIGQRKFEKEEHERRGAPESTVLTSLTWPCIGFSTPTLVSRSIKLHGV